MTSNPTDDPAPYLYTGDSEPLLWKLNPWSVLPTECYSLIEFTCENTEGPEGFNSICLGGTFDSTNGDFSFVSKEIRDYPPGDYTIVITGKIGDNTVTYGINVTIQDPCPTT